MRTRRNGYSGNVTVEYLIVHAATQPAWPILCVEIPQRCLRLPTSPVRGQGASLVRCLFLYFDGTLSK